MSKLTVKDCLARPATEEEKTKSKSWGTWGCEVSKFDWEYNGNEEAVIDEGEVVVYDLDGGSITAKAGDYVQFPDGFKCVWDVKKKIAKHYNFY